jgi:alkylation response protein AidB-like acyl-CoA dehydrogenase
VDLQLGPEERSFRDELLAWIAAATRPDGLRDYGATPTQDDITAARTWQRVLCDDGWAGLSWPKEHGGRGATPVELAIFAEEMARAGLPRQVNLVSLELAGPMIITYGTDAQRNRFLPRILRGEDVWCQLFSEPGAGSDLAGVQTRAVPVGDGWRVTGQKVWTSGAHYADYGLLLARTDPSASVHSGISCFLLPMDRGGIDVRPLRQMDGESKFNEVFLDGVEVTAGDLLGSEGQGWEVAVSTLGRERVTLGAQAVTLLDALEAMLHVARARGVSGDAVFRQRYAQAWSRVRLLRVTWLRALSHDGGVATPAMSVLKLASSELQRDVAALGDILGPALVAGDDDEGWRHRLLAAPGQRIAGGTSEIQRNIIAERALGLPKGPR